MQGPSYSWATINRPPAPPHQHWCGHIRDVVAKVDGERRGIAMGIAQGLGSSLMGSFVAPASVTSDASRGSLAALGLGETAPRILLKASAA